MNHRIILILALLLAGISSPAWAQGVEPRLVVAGHGKAVSAADRAVVTVTIRATGTTGSEARTRVASLNDGIVRELAALGIPSSAVAERSGGRFGFVGNEAVMDMDSGAGPRPPAQAPKKAATRSLSVTVDDLRLLPKVIDALSDRQGVTLGNTAYDLKDSRASRRAAIADAIALARADAEAYARAIGMRLGSLMSVKDQAAEPSMMTGWSEMMEQMVDHVGSTTSQVTTTANVAVEFALVRP